MTHPQNPERDALAEAIDLVKGVTSFLAGEIDRDFAFWSQRDDRYRVPFKAWRQLRDALALLAEPPRQPEAGGWRPTHRHLKTGGLYQKLGTASLQAADAIYEDEDLVFYRGVKGDLWARPADEFNDGRFEALPDAPPTPAVEQGR